MNAPQAHRKVAAAVRAGTLVRQPCEVCGDSLAEAHHDDYNKPLEVRWLCKRHHSAHHYPPRDPSMMLRANITRQELADLKIVAIKTGMTTQQLLALLIRDKLNEEPPA